jgi:(E)-4-hydroxy-3-methylbut-2-enyl-diphosphate synthase
MERKLTKKIMVGGVPVGGGAPVSIQSMLNTRTTDVDGCLAQIRALAAAGCEIARLAVPDMEAAEAFGAICAASPLPLVADIHFDYRLAIRAAENGAAKIRINPGNIGGEERVRAVVEACGARNIPIRIGVNGGRGGAPLHSSKFDFDEEVLLVGVEAFKRILESENYA